MKGYYYMKATLVGRSGLSVTTMSTASGLPGQEYDFHSPQNTKPNVSGDRPEKSSEMGSEKSNDGQGR